MRAFVIVAALMVVVLAYHSTNALPVDNAGSSESSVPPEPTEEVSDDRTDHNVTSEEAVYLIKEISYEVGIVDAINIDNKTAVVLVTPEDRIETDDISVWTAGNVTGPEYETTEPVLAETTVLPEAAARTTEGNDTSASAASEQPANDTADAPQTTSVTTPWSSEEAVSQPNATEYVNQTSADASVKT